MSRRFFHGQVVIAERAAFILPLLAGCFFLGALFGNAAAEREMIAAEQEVQQYLSSFFSLLQGKELERTSLLADVFFYWKYPLLLFFFGFFGFGVAAIPAVLFYQGFSLSFAVSAVLGTFGEKGILWALLLFGFRYLFVLPCAFLVARDALGASWHRLRRRNEKNQPLVQDIVLRFFLCIVLLFMGAALEHAFLPELLRSALT